MRLLLGLALLAFVFARLDLQELQQALLGSVRNWEWSGLAILLVFAALYVGVIRWHRMLVTLGVPIRFWRSFQILFIGQFFNTFMPGACGGDAVRAYYVVRETGSGLRAEAGTTVVADRLVGLFVIILFVCIIVPFRLHFLLAQTSTKGPTLLILAFLACCVLGLICFFRIHLFERFDFFRRLEERFRVGPLIRRAYDALYHFRSRPAFLLEMGFYSLLNLILLTLSCQCLAVSIGLDIRLVDMFTFFPIITVLASVPLTPGALGLRENLFAEMFKSVGVAKPASVALSLLVYAVGLIAGLVGGLIFIGFSGGRKEALAEIQTVQEDAARA